MIKATYRNDTILTEEMPDPTQCGLYDAAGSRIPCPSQRAMGGPTGSHQAYNVPAGQGIRLRVTVNASAGLRTESNSPLAAATGGAYDFQLQHCYAGVLVSSATIRDPDNLDTTFSNGDELTIRFNVETAMAPVTSKWDIDKLLTFCTPCNPGCERSGEQPVYDSEYNGLGSEYSGYWHDPRTLVIVMINTTLPSEGECYRNEGDPTMPFTSNAWRVMTSYSATQAPMARCGFGNGNEPQCMYGDASSNTVTDQFGNDGLEEYARMLGPRYPHRWGSPVQGCENFMAYWQDYQQGIYSPRPISGSVGPVKSMWTSF